VKDADSLPADDGRGVLAARNPFAAGSTPTILTARIVEERAEYADRV